MISHKPSPSRRVLSCGKVRYRDGDLAKRALKLIQRNPGDRVPVRAYRCPGCAGWHLTSED